MDGTDRRATPTEWRREVGTVRPESHPEAKRIVRAKWDIPNRPGMFRGDRSAERLWRVERVAEHYPFITPVRMWRTAPDRLAKCRIAVKLFTSYWFIATANRKIPIESPPGGAGSSSTISAKIAP